MPSTSQKLYLHSRSYVNAMYTASLLNFFTFSNWLYVLAGKLDQSSYLLWVEANSLGWHWLNQTRALSPLARRLLFEKKIVTIGESDVSYRWG